MQRPDACSLFFPHFLFYTPRHPLSTSNVDSISVLISAGEATRMEMGLGMGLGMGLVMVMVMVMVMVIVMGC